MSGYPTGLVNLNLAIQLKTAVLVAYYAGSSP
jgi:hypothetical protein